MQHREDALHQREETFKRRLNEELNAQVRQARKEIDEVIAELKAKAEAIARAPRLVSTGDTGAARGDARAAVDAIAARLLAGEGSPAESTIESAIRSPQSAMTTVAVGSRVIVGGLGLEAIVTSVHDGTADLDVRGKRMRASIRDLRLVGGQAPAARVSVNVELQPRETTASDLNVIGCTVDEALTRTERFLDESLLTDQRVIRLIHGYGTGQLKRALAGFLQQHPLVARFATAPPNQGGGGVTVVELKD
jgi:DNA mismatch repair protein MutS2